MTMLEAIREGERLRVLNPTRGAVVVQELRLALGPVGRLRGLLGRPPLVPGEGLLLRPCRGVHTFFMGYSIDVAFLDRRGTVVEQCPGLKPWRMTPIVPEAYSVLELPADRLASTGTVPGDLLAFEPW